MDRSIDDPVIINLIRAELDAFYATTAQGTTADTALQSSQLGVTVAELITGTVPAAQLPSNLVLDTELTSAIDAAINGLVDAAPGTLDTLNELAAAIGDDPNFAGSIVTALAGKQDQINGVTFTDIGTPAATDKVLLQDASDSDVLKTAAFSEFVATTSDQTVGGVKTFSSSPIVPAPTTDLQAANRAFVLESKTQAFGAAYPIASQVLTSWTSTNTQIRFPNVLGFLPMSPTRTCTVDEALVEVTTGADFTRVRVGIYTSNSVTGIPDTLITEFGTIDSTTSGQKTIVLGAPLSLNAGVLYWLAAGIEDLAGYVSGGPILRTANHTGGVSVPGYPQSSLDPGTGVRAGFIGSYTSSGAVLPASAPSISPDRFIPLVGLRVATVG